MPLLGYWNVRGICEPICFLLHHAGVDFEEKRYGFGTAPEYDRKEWLDEKFTLGLDFPNLPYYIEDDLKLTQSIVILRHLAKKHGLYPEKYSDILKAEMAEQLSGDITTLLLMYGYGPECIDESYKGFITERINGFVKNVSEYLGDRDWLVDNKVSYVDFLMYHTLENSSYLLIDSLKRFKNLGDFVKRIQQLPKIQEYINGGRYQSWPIFSPYARWGGNGEEPKRDI